MYGPILGQVLWVLIGAMWAEEGEAVGLQWADVGTVTAGPPGEGEREKWLPSVLQGPGGLVGTGEPLFPCEGGQRQGRAGAMGAFCANPATYLPSPRLQKRISVFTARKMEQNNSLRALSSFSSVGALPMLPAQRGGEVHGATGPGAWLLAMGCAGSGDKIRSLPSAEDGAGSSLV